MAEVDEMPQQETPAAAATRVTPDATAAERPEALERLAAREVRRRDGVLELARRCEEHRAHSAQVEKLAGQLLDGLRGHSAFAGAPTQAAELLSYAAQLHDIGYITGTKGHHKHSWRLIAEADLPGITPRERAIIAAVARFHTKRWRGPGHKVFAGMASEDYETVRMLAAVLRVADGLDRSHRSVVRHIAVRLPDPDAGPATGRIELQLDVAGEADSEIWGAGRKANLLEEVAGRPVLIDILQADRSPRQEGRT